ncbi:MAG: hypothetical protein QG574_399 [Cyanobacteriota bacterium erpe_2018_sw_21hr_WHONDRS-SW48-000092_B_bin.40]|nr:hypothetical protein [Cyanobacteriota bacterium erpe_2018_sw_21hr_WHONDRS-SW48-000092_B_bin.40]
MIDPDLVLLLVLTIGIWRGTITVQLHSVSLIRKLNCENSEVRSLM